MQKEFTTNGPVLDKTGHPIPGYSTRSMRQYDRKAIKAMPWRIKEWDFYQISNDHLCLQFTIGHTAYAGQCALMLFDFIKGEKIIDIDRLIALPFGSMHMPDHAEKDSVLTFAKGGAWMQFTTRDDVRHLQCRWNNIECDITLERQTPHGLVINIPFDESPKQFYYNHKINCMTASGFAKKGDETYTFLPEESFGILDWGRGVWPFKNEWYWSNGSGYINGKMFGFNLGCGFGNPSAATENILFYDGKAHKLGNVKFDLGREYMDPWHLYDDEGRLDLTLMPTYDRTTKVKVLWINNCTHQMFGKFTGFAVLDDGTRLEIDNVISFAEHAANQW